MVEVHKIPIEKDLVPYSFLVELSNQLYKFEVNYNAIHDFFTVNLFLNNEPVLYGEKVMLNVPLFHTKLHLEVPRELIVPLSTDESETQVTFENFGDTVGLYSFVGDVDELI